MKIVEITKDYWYQKGTEVLREGEEYEIERNEDDMEIRFDDGTYLYIPEEYYKVIKDTSFEPDDDDKDR